jgi:hypothetical protein
LTFEELIVVDQCAEEVLGDEQGLVQESGQEIDDGLGEEDEVFDVTDQPYCSEMKSLCSMPEGAGVGPTGVQKSEVGTGVGSQKKSGQVDLVSSDEEFALITCPLLLKQQIDDNNNKKQKKKLKQNVKVGQTSKSTEMKDRKK